MFFTLTLHHDVLLHPKHFGPSIHDVVKQQLHNDVESKCVGRHGFIVAVVKVQEISKGRVLFARGEVLFSVAYTALIFRPIAGQVVDATVTSVSKVGIFVEIGPLTAFISDRWVHDMEYDANANPPCFKSSDGTETIEPDDGVRVKIMAVRINAAEIVVTASLAGNYLGLLN
eukprot:TRINITY_DN10709_c0_g2_i1.p1 TRINITY_DN10709_c0_g2~~TRINITY_DN10709_c0_g2_i1.p1  ORF type:complete len:172 (+),score=24.19 TRINITY_DN10709_c0_g2_i1:96-611(+)